MKDVTLKAEKRPKRSVEGVLRCRRPNANVATSSSRSAHSFQLHATGLTGLSVDARLQPSVAFDRASGPDDGAGVSRAKGSSGREGVLLCLRKDLRSKTATCRQSPTACARRSRIAVPIIADVQEAHSALDPKGHVPKLTLAYSARVALLRASCPPRTGQVERTT